MTSFPTTRISPFLAIRVEESNTLVPWINLPSTWAEVPNTEPPDGIADEVHGFYRMRVENPCNPGFFTIPDAR